MGDDRVISAMARTLECLKNAYKYQFHFFKAYLARIHIGIFISDYDWQLIWVNWSQLKSNFDSSQIFWLIYY